MVSIPGLFIQWYTFKPTCFFCFFYFSTFTIGQTPNSFLLLFLGVLENKDFNVKVSIFKILIGTRVQNSELCQITLLQGGWQLRATCSQTNFSCMHLRFVSKQLVKNEKSMSSLIFILSFEHISAEEKKLLPFARLEEETEFFSCFDTFLVTTWPCKEKRKLIFCTKQLQSSQKKQ